MNIDEYMCHDAVALADVVAHGDITATELLQLACWRADTVNSRLNALISRIGLPAAARAADPHLSGPFAGVPFLLKDLGQEYKGMPCSSGSRSLAAFAAPANSEVTQRFLNAGLVIFGQTNTAELGMKAVTEPQHWGPAHNPWNLRHTPGGSSGGSGAAVAAGIVPAAGANDGAGSIRIPAACNGLVGLKTSRGLTPNSHQGSDARSRLVTQGVLSRTVRDSAALYDAIVDRDHLIGYHAPTPNTPFAKQIQTPPATLRIGYTHASAITSNPHPEAITAVENAAKVLSDLGHQVEPVTPPCDDAALTRDFLTIWFAGLHHEVTSIKQRFTARDRDFEADTLAAAELGRSAGPNALSVAVNNTTLYDQSLAAFHRRYDYLLTPTIATPPPLIGALSTPRGLRGMARLAAKTRSGKALARMGLLDQIIHDNLGWVPYTQIANLTGRPAISVPLHWTQTGLPLGVQFIGRLGADAELLQLAAQLEQAQPWQHRYTETVFQPDVESDNPADDEYTRIQPSSPVWLGRQRRRPSSSTTPRFNGADDGNHVH